jgi:hypothetical protein
VRRNGRMQKCHRKSGDDDAYENNFVHVITSSGVAGGSMRLRDICPRSRDYMFTIDLSININSSN